MLQVSFLQCHKLTTSFTKLQSVLISSIHSSKKNVFRRRAPEIDFYLEAYDLFQGIYKKEKKHKQMGSHGGGHDNIHLRDVI